MAKDLTQRDDNSVPVLALLNTDTGEVKMAHGEGGLDKPLLGIMSYVWDTDSLLPVKMTQQAFSSEDLEELAIGNYFPDIRFEYDGDGNCIYKGMNQTLDASEGATDWNIFRYDYTTGNCIRKRYRVTSWTNRASGW